MTNGNLSYFVYFWIYILCLPCVAWTFSFFSEQSSTVRPYGKFRTLWEPYTRLHRLPFLHTRPVFEMGLPSRRTIYITVEGNVRTPSFMKDFYYADGPIGTRLQKLYLDVIPLSKYATSSRKIYNSRRFASTILRAMVRNSCVATLNNSGSWKIQSNRHK